jgi:hypothetical protein
MGIQRDIVSQEWIDPDALLGHCWAMNGSRGFLDFQLAKSIEAHVLVLEHVIPQISLDAGYSALKDFRVWVSRSILLIVFSRTNFFLICVDKNRFFCT